MYSYFYRFILTISCIMAQVNGKLLCPLTKECDCLIGDVIEIVCPNRNETDIIVRIDSVGHIKRIQIHCNEYNANAFNRLPEWDVYEMEAIAVQFDRCAVMKLTKMQQIFHRLNVKRVQSLKLYAGSTDETSDNEHTLSEHLFDDFPSITEISIEYSNISKVHENVFAKMKSLQNLSLAHNAIIELSPNVFNTQTHLWALDLSFNRLTELDDTIFKSTSNLTILRLSHNQLTKISSHLFSGLSGLQELYLQNNRLVSIHMTALDGTNLRVLQLQNNFIEFSIDALDFDKASPFQNLFKLEQLNMRNNSIKHYLSDWNILNLALKEIDLSYNQIRMIDFGFVMNSWVNHITINLTHNQISTIRTGNGFVNLNESRSTWILNDNPLNCDCQIVQFANYLRHTTPDKPLKLITNQLKCSAPLRFVGQSPANIPLNEFICPLDKENVKGKKHCPHGCNCYVRTIDSTAIFNCSNANLIKVPALPNIRDLRLKSYELYIEFNNITELPATNATGYHGVRKLYAKNNSIDHIDWDHLPRDLITLDVSHNCLKNVSESILALVGGHHMQNISFGGNPWICDCGAFGLVKFVKLHPAKIQDINEIICTNGQQMKLLNADDLCPTDATTIIILSMAALMGILMAFVAIFYHVYQLEIAIWWIVRCNCSLFVGKKNIEAKKYDAFIIYQDDDAEAVENELIENLENKNGQLKLCSLNRDTLVGSYLFQEVSIFVKNSRRTVIVLTPRLVDGLLKKGTEEREAILNFWGFRVAHATALKERRSKVVIIAKDMTADEMDRIRTYDDELDAYLNTNIYLKWNDAKLYDKIRLAIGHPEYFKSKSKPKSKLSQLINV